MVLVTACAGAPEPVRSSAYRSTCSEDALCLNVRTPPPGAPSPYGQLLVVWATPGVSAPPEIAFQEPFTGQERSYRIPFSRIRPPSAPALYQAPQCDALALNCRANSVALAYVVVVATDQGTTPDAAEFGHRAYGAAPVMIGFAANPIGRGEQALSAVLPGGMRSGIAAYYSVKPAGGRFDQLWPATPGTVFDLVVCTPQSGCEPPVPNIS